MKQLKLYLDKRVNFLAKYLFNEKPFIENLETAFTDGSIKQTQTRNVGLGLRPIK